MIIFEADGNKRQRSGQEAEKMMMPVVVVIQTGRRIGGQGGKIEDWEWDEEEEDKKTVRERHVFFAWIM